MRFRNRIRIIVTIFSFSVMLWGCEAQVQPTDHDRGQKGEVSHADCCEPRPPGKASGQGNTDAYIVCIPSNPANNDQTCAIYSQQLHDKAGLRALAICTGVHNVTCVDVDCDDVCVNTATLSSSGSTLTAPASPVRPMRMRASWVTPPGIARATARFSFE